MGCGVEANTALNPVMAAKQKKKPRNLALMP